MALTLDHLSDVQKIVDRFTELTGDHIPQYMSELYIQALALDVFGEKLSRSSMGLVWAQFEKFGYTVQILPSGRSARKRGSTLANFYRELLPDFEGMQYDQDTPAKFAVRDKDGRA